MLARAEMPPSAMRALAATTPEPRRPPPRLSPALRPRPRQHGPGRRGARGRCPSARARGEEGADPAEDRLHRWLPLRLGDADCRRALCALQHQQQDRVEAPHTGERARRRPLLGTLGGSASGRVWWRPIGGWPGSRSPLVDSAQTWAAKARMWTDFGGTGAGRPTRGSQGTPSEASSRTFAPVAPKSVHIRALTGHV